MLKKKRYVYTQLIYQDMQKYNCLLNLVHLSIRENFESTPIKRNTIRPLEYYYRKKYSLTKHKWRCLISGTKSVPTRRLGVSRFFLVKYSDSLKLTNLLR